MKKVFKWWKRWQSLLMFSAMMLLLVAFAGLGVMKFREGNRKVTVHELNFTLASAYLVGWDGGKKKKYNGSIITAVLDLYGTEEKFFEEVKATDYIEEENKTVIINTFKFLRQDYYTSRKK